MNIRGTLETLGYRILPDGKSMCKPVGYNMFKYNLETNTIFSHFYGDGIVKDLLTWDSQVIEIKDNAKFLKDISTFEHYNQDHGRYVDFSFGTVEQFWNSIL